MKRVFTAANLQEAHLIRHILHAARIDAHVFNENAIGGLGDLPVTHPEVWISDERDVDLAKRIVSEHENQKRYSDAEKSCAACGEPNPANFDLCWRCNAGLDPLHGV